MNKLIHLGHQIEDNWPNDHLRRELLLQFATESNRLEEEMPTLAKKFHQKRRELTNYTQPEQFLSHLVLLERESSQLVPETIVSTTDKKVSLNSLKRNQLIIVLENIRSAFNVGSILRTADAMGVGEVYFCGYTANPDHPQVTKTSLGAENFVKWKSFSRTILAIEELKRNGYQIYAFETSPQATSLDQFIKGEIKVGPKMAFLFGNERYGLSPHTLEACDQLVQIPMVGMKNSLNVSNAAAIAAYTYYSIVTK